MVAIPYRMGVSYPGEITRHQDMLIEPLIITESGTTGSPTVFGCPIVMDATTKKGRSILSGDTLASIVGFLVRDYPSNSISNDALLTSTPLTRPGAAMSLFKKGYLAVKLAFGTAVQGAPVYARLTTASSRIIGDIEASPDGTATAGSMVGTGNATISAVTLNNTALAAPRNGNYRITMTSATAFTVFDPNGNIVGTGTLGVAFANQIGFTATAGGTPAVAGDYFNVLVAMTNVALPRTVFMGAADSSGITEIRYNI